ncbi:centromere protein L [Megalopta genalis]|uniref:centromere protein L n=1 Tax=Megalopta genalis TaxID=115081 RepID=UPI003FD1CFEA
MENTQRNILPSTSRATKSPLIPGTREQQHFCLGINSSSVEGLIENLSELLHKTWTVYGVSTLFNFHEDEVHLKQYSKRLREKVATTLTQENVAYKVKMFVMDHVTTRPSPMDPLPIKIEVYGKNLDHKDSTEKCIYTGILLSWNTSMSELTTPNSIRLPLLLCRGTKSSMVVIHALLSHMFDCMIIELSAQEEDLIWLIPIIITPTNKKHSEHVGEIRMEYRIPGLPDKNNVTVKVKVSALIKILKVVMKDQIDTSNTEISFNLEHIERFRTLLYNQVLRIASIQLGLSILCKISLPSFSIRGNKIKLVKKETMNRVLLYLNQKAVNILHTLSFEI